MSAEIREQRLQEGCCPNCGTQLYKIISQSKANVMSKMSMFNNKSQDASSNYPKKEPLNIPGIVERGQCVKCANGNTNIALSSSDVVDTLTSSSPIAIGEHMSDVAAPVKAVPVTISPTSINDMARKPPPSSPVVGNLKQPPETLLAAAMKKEEESSSSGSEEESDSDDSSYYTTSSGDGESLEDVDMLIDTQMHRLESDQASSDLVNTLKKNAKFNASGQVGDYIPGKGGSDAIVDSNGIIIDDRKPAAKPTVEESSDQLRKLQLEAAAIDMACLEATNSKPQDDTKMLQCPSGMSPDVFYELPPEMQKEVLAQEARKSSNAAATTFSDIDPETLASLPDNIRQEVLEQARREQQQKTDSIAAAAAAATSSSIDRLEDMKKHKLSASTTAFLSDCDINAEDYEKFPEEIKNDIMKEKKRRDSKTSIEPLGQTQLEDLDTSGYDRETLASLPEELRNEVLEEERRKKEKKRRESQASGNRPSAVGAHSVSNVPAGYDPETFAELPEEMKRELLDDAARRQQSGGGRYSADGYDYESIVDAQVVPAQPMRSGGGTATSCTYEGEYNIMGKRHGDGELKWANGDKYVGKFKNGYIDGRGTINFHDGKFVLHFQ